MDVMRRLRVLLFIVMMLVAVMPVAAQEEQQEDATTPPADHTAQEIVIEAADGLDLTGYFWLVDPNRPTVILLHELYKTHTMWEPVRGLLLMNHYNVLEVDQRGFGETRGAINWFKAVDDVQVWFDWLRNEAGVRGDAISTMGSSMGATTAILGCANDAHCRTVIAVSPGWRYYNVSVEEAFTETLAGRPVLLVYAENDRWPALGVPNMVEAGGDSVTVQTYPLNTHGINLMRREQATFVPLFLDWLAQHGG